MPIVSAQIEDALNQVAERGELPFKGKRSSDDDDELTAIVNERLAAPQRVKLSLAELD